MPRELGALAVAQLRAWEGYASDWPVRALVKHDALHLCCAVCEMTIIPLTREGEPYTFTHGTFLMMAVAHLRNVHRDVETEVYAHGDGTTGEDKETAHSARIAGVGYFGDIGTD